MAPAGSRGLFARADDAAELMCQLGDGAATRGMSGHPAFINLSAIWASGVDAAGRGVLGAYFHLASEVGRVARRRRAVGRYAKGAEATSRESRGDQDPGASRAGH